MVKEKSDGGRQPPGEERRRKVVSSITFDGRRSFPLSRKKKRGQDDGTGKGG